MSFNEAGGNFFITCFGFYPFRNHGLITYQQKSSGRYFIVEAYRKRRYPKYFISKLSDADGENSETILWLDFAKRFNYMDEKTYIDLTSRCSSIGNLLNYMMKNHDKFC